MPIIVALTLFISAFLLFSLQPLIGRMLLPLLGGSPAVWNTCLVVFQAELLLGYLYAHWLSTRIAPLPQRFIHAIVLMLPLFALPPLIRLAVPVGQDELPIGWLSLLLVSTAGLPFFVVATTSPLLQRWFAATGRPDPYYLAAISNLGSLVGLVAYPFFIEPRLTLVEQGRAWSVGYMVFAGMVLLCAIGLRRGNLPRPTLTGGPRPWRWIALALVPSSWLMGMGTYITTDLVSHPWFWVIQLGLYLVTFILAFSRLPIPLSWLARATGVCSLVLILAILIGASDPPLLILGLHWLTFFIASWFCHATLAAERPPAEYLTAFYLWMAVGGVLGGLLNAVLAPVLFSQLGLIEYPAMAILVGLFRRGAPLQRGDFWYLFSVSALSLTLVLLAQLPAISAWLSAMAQSFGVPLSMLRAAWMFALPCLFTYMLVDRPLRYVLGLASLYLIGSIDPGPQGVMLHRERNYLGVLTITRSEDGRFVRLVHGNTIHGQQCILPERSPLPLTYYHPTGPIGQIFQTIMAKRTGPLEVAAIGLGTGSMAYYARPHERWTYYELDPAVERLARDERYFTYLRDCQASSLQVIPGDARLRLQDAADGQYTLMVLDAFSSDAIPMHLLTAEALALYSRKLTPDGLLVFHISNRYLDLAPILARLAEGEWSVLVADDMMGEDTGKYPSRWLVMAKRPEDLVPLKKKLQWGKVTVPPDTPRWTDDFSNLLSAWRSGE